METDQPDWSALDAQTLRQRRADLIGSLPPLERVMYGSLIARYTHCGKPNCHCKSGQGHGPHYYLSTLGPNGRTRLEYVPTSLAAAVRERIGRHHDVQSVLAQVADINRELLRRRDTSEFSP